MMSQRVRQFLILATAAAPIVWIVLTPFIFALLQAAVTGIEKLSECRVLGVAVLTASGWGLLHQLFVGHNHRLGPSAPLLPQLIAFGVSTAFGIASWLVICAPHGFADLLLTASAVLINASISVVVVMRKRRCGPNWVGLTRECIVLGVVIWIVVVAQLVDHFRHHEAWAISGIAAAVAVAQALYIAELCGLPVQSNGGEELPIECRRTPDRLPMNYTSTFRQN